jgi:hypothetical protein
MTFEDKVILELRTLELSHLPKGIKQGSFLIDGEYFYLDEEEGIAFGEFLTYGDNETLCWPKIRPAVKIIEGKTKVYLASENLSVMQDQDINDNLIYMMKGLKLAKNLQKIMTIRDERIGTK